jgi:hypothetical protein
VVEFVKGSGLARSVSRSSSNSFRIPIQQG